MTVHHVDMDAVRAGSLGLGDLLAEASEIRRQDGGGELHARPSKVSTNSR